MELVYSMSSPLPYSKSNDSDPKDHPLYPAFLHEKSTSKNSRLEENRVTSFAINGRENHRLSPSNNYSDPIDILSDYLFTYPNIQSRLAKFS